MIALSRLSHIHTFCPPLFSAVLLRLILCLENKFCPSFLRFSKKSFVGFHMARRSRSAGSRPNKAHSARQEVDL